MSVRLAAHSRLCRRGELEWDTASMAPKPRVELANGRIDDCCWRGNVLEALL
jgi:hypothetical protein